MKDDELSPILGKTRDCLSFIKCSLSKKAIALKDDDSNTLGKIEAYLKMSGMRAVEPEGERTRKRFRQMLFSSSSSIRS